MCVCNEKQTDYKKVVTQAQEQTLMVSLCSMVKTCKLHIVQRAEHMTLKKRQKVRQTGWKCLNTVKKDAYRCNSEKRNQEQVWLRLGSLALMASLKTSSATQ